MRLPQRRGGQLLLAVRGAHRRVRAAEGHRHGHVPRGRDRRADPGRARRRGDRAGRRAGDPRGRRPRGGELPDHERPHDDRAPPRLRHLPRRRDGLTRSRAAGPPQRRDPHRRPRFAQRHVREPPADREPQAGRRRRAADRQVQADVPRAMTVGEQDIPVEEGKEPPRKSMTIGAVCKALDQEFPDISISKIRYLEDQKLLSPRRTPGGYRLYSQSDVVRLRTILRLQRDEFLPLRVIRQELAAGRSAADIAAPGGDARARRRPSVSVQDRGPLYTLDDVLEETQAEASLVAELEDFGVIKGEVRAGAKYYDETEREIIRAVTELARYGVGGRNLRVLRTSADRESALLQQILAPALRSRNPERRKEALEALENLAAVTSHLKHLLLVRDLRKIAN